MKQFERLFEPRSIAVVGETSLELVSSHMAIVQATSDYREAIQAYKEKRAPKFEGR